MKTIPIGTAVSQEIAPPVTAVNGRTIGQALSYEMALPIHPTYLFSQSLVEPILPMGGGDGTPSPQPERRNYERELGLVLAFLLWLFYEEVEEMRHWLRELVFWLIRGGK